MLVISAGIYVAVVAERTYEARSDLVLIAPPGPPTEAELERDPDLASATIDNPYARVFDPAVITEIVARAVAARRLDWNLPSDYRIDAARRYGSAAPLVEIAARADTPELATVRARTLSDAFVATLDDLQSVEDVHPRALITTRLVDDASDPEELLTRRLRAVVIVLAGGALLVMVAIGIVQVAGTSRTATRHQGPGRPMGPPTPQSLDPAPTGAVAPTARDAKVPDSSTPSALG
jgi:hypothetical protein